jgi:two-component system, LytTR family, response regulator
MNTLKAIIIDDERSSIESLRFELAEYCPEVELIESCQDPYQGKELILKTNPDLIFLDIEMPGMNGFEFLERTPHKNFGIIFTTAYNEYAIKAIKHSALDYLLKPIDKNELIEAVEKAKQQNAQKTSSRVEQLLSSLNLKKESKRFAVPTLEGLIMLNSEEILYCESDGPYCTFHFTTNTKPLLTSKTLKEAEEVLQGGGEFFRVHHSFLINLKFVQKYIRGEGGEVIMNNGKNIPVARSRKQDFMKVLERI